jgi:hypothetical protein
MSCSVIGSWSEILTSFPAGGKGFASRVEHYNVEAPWFGMPVSDEYSHLLGDLDAH